MHWRCDIPYVWTYDRWRLQIVLDSTNRKSWLHATKNVWTYQWARQMSHIPMHSFTNTEYANYHTQTNVRRCVASIVYGKFHSSKLQSCIRLTIYLKTTYCGVLRWHMSCDHHANRWFRFDSRTNYINVWMQFAIERALSSLTLWNNTWNQHQ